MECTPWGVQNLNLGYSVSPHPRFRRACVSIMCVCFNCLIKYIPLKKWRGQYYILSPPLSIFGGGGGTCLPRPLGSSATGANCKGGRSVD